MLFTGLFSFAFGAWAGSLPFLIGFPLFLAFQLFCWTIIVRRIAYVVRGWFSSSNKPQNRKWARYKATYLQ